MRSSFCIHYSTTTTSTTKNEKDLVSENATYIEGSFMCALYNKLEGMLDRSLDENLTLTEIFAKLAQCPDQRVQNLLIWEKKDNDNDNDNNNDNDNDNDNGNKMERRSLVLVLKSVWQEAQDRVNEVDNFDGAIEAHRVRLGTIMEGRHGDRDTPKASRNNTKMQSSFCEGYVLLEEFVKEISAIIQARGELEVLYRRLM